MLRGEETEIIRRRDRAEDRGNTIFFSLVMTLFRVIDEENKNQFYFEQRSAPQVQPLSTEFGEINQREVMRPDFLPTLTGCFSAEETDWERVAGGVV